MGKRKAVYFMAFIRICCQWCVMLLV